MKYTGYFDGSSKGNPGPAQCGWIIFDDQKKEFARKVRKSKVDQTNNVAEYVGLIELLKFVLFCDHIGEIEIFGDSALVINQVNGKWKCKSPNLQVYYNKAIEHMYSLKDHSVKVTLTWVPREQNTVADNLAQKGDT